MASVRSVDEYIEKHHGWAEVLVKLRRVLGGSGLEETIKWGVPTYALDGKNVVGLAAFKEHVALWFHQGVFLSDPDGVLVNAQQGRTKALRQWRFTKAGDVKVGRVKAYVKEAIDNQRQGRVVAPERKQGVDVPSLLREALARRPKAKRAFATLTPGKQREYAEHIASAKQEKTRESRLAKVLPMIEAGVGLHDRYRRG